MVKEPSCEVMVDLVKAEFAAWSSTWALAMGRCCGS